MNPTRRLPLAIHAALAFTLTITAGRLGHADTPVQCTEMQQGDVAACKQRVKAECTQAQYWDRRRCEDAIVAKLDVCISRHDEATAACAEAAAIEDRTCTASFDSVGIDRWITAANRIDAEEKRHAAVRAQWGGCEVCRRVGKDACTGTAARLKAQLTAEVDKVLARDWRETAAEHLANHKERRGDLDLSNARYAATYTKEQVQRWLDVNAKIPAALRVKERELRAEITDADALLAQTTAVDRADVAARACPAGKKLAGRWARMIKDKIGPTHTAKVKVMRQGAIYRSREGMISMESIPITLCERDRVDGKDVCSVSKFGVYRERPPGGSWTSWAVSVGGGYEISCAKLR